MKRLLFICLLILAMGNAATSNARSLRILTLDSAPLAFMRDGEVVGIAADLVREGLQRMGYEADIRIVPWVRALYMVRLGDAEAIFPAGYNAERATWFHYPHQSLFEVQAVPVKHLNGSIKFSVDRFDYSEYKLGEVRGGYFGPNYKKFMETANFKEVEQTSSTIPNLYKLKDKRIDLFITPYHEARYLIHILELEDSLEIVGNEDGTPMVVDSSQVHLAFSRQIFSEAMAERFSDAITSMKLDGTYEKIQKRYYLP